MPFQIIRNDLSKMKVDVLVSPTHPEAQEIGGLEATLFKRGGEALLKERQSLGPIKMGEVKATKAYNLNAKYVFHTVGPIWHGDEKESFTILRSCYQNSLELAQTLNIKTIAFPLIATGSFQFPKDKALRIAVDTIKAFLYEHDMTIYLVVYDKESFVISRERFKSVQSYLDDYQVYEIDNRQRQRIMESIKQPDNLDDFINNLDKTFSEALLDKITELGKLDQEIYKKANIDRKLFSKIRSNHSYQPSKNTAMALGLALELNLDEFNDFIAKAGYALSPSSKVDLIIRYYIEHNVYDLFEINATLFEFTNKTL